MTQDSKTEQRTAGTCRRINTPTLHSPKKDLKENPPGVSTTILAKTLGVTRQSLYYTSIKEKQDWELKTKIEETLQEHPSYGSRRISQALNLNRKGIRRVMRKYGIKPYRRRGRKQWKKRKIKPIHPNLLHSNVPSYPHHFWASDFTELKYRNLKIYVATVTDLYLRKVVGVAVSLRKGTPLVLQALGAALLHHPHPTIFHSDNGREYDSNAFVSTLKNFSIVISRIYPGRPWENGYQESFYDKFKVDLGDPNRFHSFGELIAEIYRTIWKYNNTRIHSALKMPPRMFEKQLARGIIHS